MALYILLHQILLCCSIAIALKFTCQPVRQNGRRSEKRQECSLYSRQRKHLLLWRRCELWNRPPMMSRKEFAPIVFHNPQVWEAFILCQGRWEMWNRPPMMFTPIVFHNPQVWEASQGRWQTNPYTQWVLPSQVPQLTWLWQQEGRGKIKRVLTWPPPRQLSVLHQVYRRLLLPQPEQVYF